MPTIRTARPADLAALDALFARAYPRLLKPDYAPSVLVGAIPVIARAQPQLLASGTYFVALDDAGALVGAGGWTAAIPGQGGAEPGRGNIRHVVTDDRRVRQGIGRAVMAATFDSARAAGITWLHCFSTLTAEPFYAACGFVRTRPVTLPLGPGRIGFAAVEMVRDL